MGLFLKLVAAHIITDFWLQPNEWVAEKKSIGLRSGKFWLHILLTTMIAAIFTWNMKDWWFVPLFIGTTHAIIDIAKIKSGRDDLVSFCLDQFAHLLMIGIGTYFAGELSTLEISKLHEWLNAPSCWLLIIAIAMIVHPAGYFVGMATAKWRNEITDDQAQSQSLNNAGLWIGRLERLLVFTFMVMGEFSAIGFLIAAKSLLRFSSGDVSQRKQSEYVLIGTLISFTISIIVGLVYLKLSSLI